MKKLIVFDLDGTLAESKSALDSEMTTLLGKLLRFINVAVISGGNWPQFQKQMLANHFPIDERLEKLSLLPTCGTKFYRYHHQDADWEKLYSEDFTEEQKKEIISAIEKAVKITGFKVEKNWGEQIEDRGSQITFSALGQEAPLEEKKKWDPDFAKRKQIVGILAGNLSEYSVQMGGTTSIDVTKPGINKAYGIHKLRDVLRIPIDEMLFVGDALFEGGNDHPAKETGAECIQVRDIEETKRVIEAVIAMAD
ncbi:MAG: HAD-IIB family hydrolase [Candidatus Omnitrophota bacterium]